MTQHKALKAAGLFLGLACSATASARSGVSIPDPPWNAEHFDALPPEIKKAIRPLCRSTPNLGHYFALYSEHSRFLNLHFEHFHCDGTAPFCRPAGCLHQVYVLSGGHYRLTQSSYHAGDD